MADEKLSALDHLLAALRALDNLAQQQRLRFTIIGGVAASLVGRPRLTKDVDVLVWLDESHWSEFLESAHKCGFRERISDTLAFARQSRVLLLRHETSGIDLDVSLGALPFERSAIQRASIVKAHGLSLRVPAPEDLIVMKWVAHRSRDLSDVEGIFDAHPKIDLAFIRQTLADFAELIPEFDLVGEFDAMLARRQSPG